MPPRPFRTNNHFGARFIRPNELLGYAEDLSLKLPASRESFLEYLEREGILFPVRRVRYPPPLVRRLALEESNHHPSETILEPIERDDSLAQDASSLHSELCFPRWSRARDKEAVHILDEIRPEHAAYIQTEFSTQSFIPWDDLKVFAYLVDGKKIHAGDRFYPTYYHYWQVFFLAAYLRSAATLLYPIDDEAAFKAVWHSRFDDEALRARYLMTVNLEARHELNALRRHQTPFEAAGYFCAYSQNAFQRYSRHADEHGRVAHIHWTTYQTQERKIAKDALARYRLTPDDLIEFVKEQCQWWSDADRRGPSLLADEWKRNIGVTLDFHRAATRSTHSDQVAAVGRVTGHFAPTLDVVFPSWIKEQRDLAIRSLKRWSDEGLAGTPLPFPYASADIDNFCAWLEEKGLYQFYWVYRRIVDGQERDDPIQRAATTTDVASFANLIEMIVNEILREKGTPLRGPQMTLVPKLRRLFGPTGPADFNTHFSRHKALMRTEHQTLRQRLAQIRRITLTAGVHTSILRYLLALVAIRNEGTHLGLLHFDRVETIELTRQLSLASLIVWKAR